MMWLVLGGIVLLVMRARSTPIPGNTGVVGPRGGGVNQFVGSPGASNAGSGVTNPLDLFTSSLFGEPAPYVPLSGPGGATTSPAGSPSPSGVARSAISPDSPGTWGPEIQSLPTSLADPAYGPLSGPLDVVMMTDVGLSPEAAALLLDPSVIMSW